MTADTWTEQRARAWLLERGYFSPQEIEWARADFAGTERHVNESRRGAAGPYIPMYETRNHHVNFWPPGFKWTEPPPICFQLAALLREAMQPKPEAVRDAVEAGNYRGPAIQGGLL